MPATMLVIWVVGTLLSLLVLTFLLHVWYAEESDEENETEAVSDRRTNRPQR